MERQVQNAETQGSLLARQVESLVNVERAWLVFQMHPAGAMMAEFTITNYGKTPAWIIELVATYGKYNEPIVAGKPIVIRAMEWPNGTIVPPGITSKPIFKNLDGTALLTESEQQLWTAGNLFLVFFGRIRYKDIFGNERETVICESWAPNLGWTVHGPPDLNRRT